MKKIAGLMAAVMVCTMLLAGCGDKKGTTTSGSDAAPAQSAVAGSGKELAVTIGPNPETMDPALNSAVDGGNMILHAFECLLIIDKDGKAVPGQAESFEKSADGLKYTFKLRKDLKWSDGSPLTANDFVYSWQRAVDPATASPYADIFNVISGFADIASGAKTPDTLGAKAIDDQTLEVTLSAPCAYFEQLVAFATYSPVQKATIEANGETWATAAKTYVSNGPFNMTDWKTGEYIEFSKNQNYWNKDAIKLDKLKFMLIEDDNAALTAYEGGEVLMTKSIPAAEIDNLSSRADFHKADLMGTYYLSLNLNKAPFDNAKVRKALSMAIDRDRIANTVMHGTYAPATAYIGPGFLDADAKTPFMDTTTKDNGGKTYFDTKADVEGAKKLLAEAGFPDGKGLAPIEYMTNDSAYHKNVAEALQQMWGEIGVKMNIVIQEWANFTAARRAGDYFVARNGWVTDYNDPSSMLDLFCSENGNNDGKYNNPAYDKLMAEARTSADQTVRMQKMHEAEKLVLDEAGMIPLAYYSDTFLQSDKIVNTWHSPLGYWHFEYADIK
ncbi:MAG: peptide ABC transporter substrate-binding protein [Oscillospiraceae bacterium]